MATFRELLAEERAKVPKGSPFSAYTAATKRASARYRGHRSNPGDGILPLVLLVGGVYVGYQLLKGRGRGGPYAPAPAPVVEAAYADGTVPSMVGAFSGVRPAGTRVDF